MKVKMAHVSTHLTRANDTEHAIIVCHITDTQTAYLVDLIDKLLDNGVKYACILRIGNKDTSCLF